MLAGEDLFHLFRGELVPSDMGDVVVVPLKTGNSHKAIVSGCIYKTLQGARDFHTKGEQTARSAPH